MTGLKFDLPQIILNYPANTLMGYAAKIRSLIHNLKEQV